MTASTETGTSESSPRGPINAGWRGAAAQAQRAVLPRGGVTVSCTAALGAGGLGRHLEEIIEALARGQQPTSCICGSTRASAQRVAPAPLRERLRIPYLIELLRALPIPVSEGVRTRAAMVEFDEYVSQRLPAHEHLVAFNSQALAQMRAARRASYQSVSLVSANPHIRRLARQHALAHRRYPLEGSWATRLLERNLAEYAEADRIYVASEYVRESFLAEGVGAERISHFPLTPDPRYTRGTPASAERYEIVYVGSLAVHKGVPLLIDAFRRVPDRDVRLRLVGGWGTPRMRRFVEGACASDGRISVCPGDPLPHLRAASLCVHPAYEDGFAYAPAEALAAGLPVIVSEDTGMKDLIEPGRDGLIVPTGDLDALTETIKAACRGEVLQRGGERAGDA